VGFNVSSKALKGNVPKNLWMYEAKGVQCPPNETLGCYYNVFKLDSITMN
jgi:hypothetical protein